MSDYGWGMFKKGLKRRKKEVRRMRVMTCLAVFFLAFALLFQDNMSELKMELNYRNCGSWFAYDSDGSFSDCSFLERSGEVCSGSNIYLTEPKAGENDIVSINDDSIVVRDLGSARNTNAVLGSFSDGFAEKNGIALYEGRFPESEGEIAAELNVLSSLGLSYDLGSEVVFYVADKFSDPEEFENEEDLYITLRPVRFTLVGTFIRYTSKWSGGLYVLPNAVVTEETIAAQKTNKTIIHFYDLIPSLRGERVWERAAELMDSLEKTEQEGFDAPQNVELRCFNRNAFLNPFWGSRGILKGVTVIIIILSSSVLAFLMSSYLIKRREYFLRMREIGANRREVCRMAAYECLLGVVPPALAAVSAAYGILLLAVFSVCSLMKLKCRFVFRAWTLVMIFCAAALVIILSLAAALVLYAGRGWFYKKKTLAVKRHSVLRNRNKRCGLRETLIRSKKIHPMKTLSKRLVVVLASVLVLLSFMNVINEVTDYAKCKLFDPDLACYYHNYNDSDFPDFYEKCYIGVKPQRDQYGHGMIDEVKVMFNTANKSLYNLIGMSLIEELRNTPGVQRVNCAAAIDLSRIDWDGKTEDQFYNYVLDKKLENYAASQTGRMEIELERTDTDKLKKLLDTNGYQLICFDDIDYVWEQVISSSGKETAEKEAFVRGEQIILLVDEGAYFADQDARSGNEGQLPVSIYEHWKTATNYYEELGSAISAGIDATIYAQVGSQGINTKVAAVAPRGGVILEEKYPLMFLSDEKAVTAVGSMEFLRKLFDAENIECGVNYFDVKYSSLANTENTSKTVIRLIAPYNIVYSDYAEAQKSRLERIEENVMTYGLFGTVLLVMFLFIMNCVSRDEFKGLQEIILKMKALGAETKKLNKDLRLDAFFESLHVLLAVPVYAAIRFVQYVYRMFGSYDNPWKDPFKYLKLLDWKEILAQLRIGPIPVLIITILLIASLWRIGCKRTVTEMKLPV